jgi:tRNA threonylcarbamoyl adenosine modification protein YeaZ
MAFTLAIETAVSQGSLAVFREDVVLAAAQGSSWSDLLLQSISALLIEAQVDRSELDRIVVSRGPGSYTGLRIGIATALGLSGSLSIPCCGVDILYAAARLTALDENTIVALPFGRAGICLQSFSGVGESIRASSPPTVGSLIDLGKEADAKMSMLVLHPDLVDQVDVARAPVSVLDPNLAALIGRRELVTEESTSLEPIYVHNPRFARQI